MGPAQRYQYLQSGIRATCICVGLMIAIIPCGLKAKEPNTQTPQTLSQARNSFAGLVENTAPAVVSIFAQKVVPSRGPGRLSNESPLWRMFRDIFLFSYGKQRLERALGSGVIVRRDGVIVTNHHVIESTRDIFVALRDGRTLPAKVLLSDKGVDLAILQVPNFGMDMPYLETADSDRAKIGDLILAIGNPFGIGQTVTMGIVSALARTNIGVTDYRFFIQTDAAINPGNSGGALINTEGKLIGVNTTIYSRSGGSVGVGFAIPANLVRAFVVHATAGKRPVWPWIGLSGRSIPYQLAMLIGMPKPQGVLITSVFNQGPADNAGITIGDIILTADGVPVGDLLALRYRIATRIVGSKVRLQGIRMGIPFSTDVSLVAPPSTPPRNDTWLPPLHPMRGAKTASLSPALAEELGLDSSITGVAILQVKRGSAAARLGLKKGDIIQTINDQDCREVGDFVGFRPPLFGKWNIGITRDGSQIILSSKK